MTIFPEKARSSKRACAAAPSRRGNRSMAGTLNRSHIESIRSRTANDWNGSIPVIRQVGKIVEAPNLQTRRPLTAVIVFIPWGKSICAAIKIPPFQQMLERSSNIDFGKIQRFQGCGRGGTVDAGDLKSSAHWACGFKSRRPHHRSLEPIRGIGEACDRAQPFCAALPPARLARTLRGTFVDFGLASRRPSAAPLRRENIN